MKPIITFQEKILRVLYIFIFFVFGLTPLKAQFTLNDTFGDLTECDTMTRGVYIVWWDNDYNLTEDVSVMLDY